MSAACGGIVPYFGAKRTLAPRIIEEFGAHSTYFELCCGSLAVLLAKPRAPMEVVIDLYDDLVNLARVLASPRWRDLDERASRTLCCDAMFHEARGIIKAQCDPAPSIAAVSEAHVERAYWFFVWSWQGRSGTVGTRWSSITPSRRFASSGGATGTRWATASASIAELHDRLAGVEIRRADAIETAQRIEDAERVVIYADPPYLEEDRYIHGFDWNQHAALAAALSSFRRARVLVSYYDHPRIRELYAGWTCIPLPMHKQMGNTNRGESSLSVAPEVLFINGPSFTEPELFRAHLTESRA